MIGGTCKHSNVFSGPVLITRGLDLNTVIKSLWSFEGARGSPAPTTSHFPVVIAAGKHLFPFRTEKLSPPAPMVLGGQPPGRVGRRRFFSKGSPRGGPFVVRKSRLPRARPARRQLERALAPQRARSVPGAVAEPLEDDDVPAARRRPRRRTGKNHWVQWMTPRAPSSERVRRVERRSRWTVFQSPVPASRTCRVNVRRAGSRSAGLVLQRVCA